MTPMLFGPPSRQLFGLFHAPEKPGTTAVLICPPFGQEEIRAHRLMRVLADRLARSGVGVLRFDYYGTGDSGGSDEDASLDGWAADLNEAHRELMRRIGDLPATWFAARLGASIALRAAPMSFPRVRRLLLWDAVFDGRAYLAELGVAQVEELEMAHSIPDPAWRRAIDKDPLALSGECLGFAIPPLLREQVLALDPQRPGEALPCSVTVVARAQDTAARQWRQATAAAHPDSGTRHVAFEHSLIWTSNPFANNEVAPAAALQHMLGELT